MDIILCPFWDERRLGSKLQEALRALLLPILTLWGLSCPLLRAEARSDRYTYPSSADGQFTGERIIIKNRQQLQEQLDQGSTSEMVPTGEIQWGSQEATENTKEGSEKKIQVLVILTVKDKPVYIFREMQSFRMACSHTVQQICMECNPKRAALQCQPSYPQLSPSLLEKQLWLQINMFLKEIFFSPHGKFLGLFCPLAVSREHREQN